MCICITDLYSEYQYANNKTTNNSQLPLSSSANNSYEDLYYQNYNITNNSQQIAKLNNNLSNNDLNSYFALHNQPYVPANYTDASNKPSRHNTLPSNTTVQTPKWYWL